MKTKFVLASFLAALCGLAALTTSARAETDLNVRLNVNLPRPPVLIVSERDRDRDYRDRSDSRECREEAVPRGYWKEVVVKTWIPGRWVEVRDNCGRESRVFERAHLAYRTDRVWVEAGHDHDRGREYDRYARR